ncbi:MAG: glycosyltransferase family 2 protein [Paludibacter sp.]|jgi:glycosyltransferase involved in cell wall biosynthesis|nr:glycosyltransferase family 2 protein [Paludibacter sp.]
MKLSIITINRNNAEGLRKTIESVVSQTYTDFEYIIIDGASTDDSVNIIKEYADRITYWVSEPDTGIYNAMNKGILKAKGEYLLFLNSGDWLYDNDVLNDVFSISPTEDIVYGNACLVFSDGIKEYTAFVERPTLNYFIDDALCHQSVFHKKEIFANSLYRDDLRFVSDWEMLLRKIIIENCSVKCIKRTICYFQMDGLTGNFENHKSIEIERIKILKEFIPERVLSDYVYFRDLNLKYTSSSYVYLNCLKNNSLLWKLSRRFLKFLYIANKYCYKR